MNSKEISQMLRDLAGTLDKNTYGDVRLGVVAFLNTDSAISVVTLGADRVEPGLMLMAKTVLLAGEKTKDAPAEKTQ